MNMSQALNQLVERKDLSKSEMQSVMRLVMTGEASPAQIAALLVALRMKGETVEEIAGAAEVMRELATPVNLSADNLVDTCGTGGDGAEIFNVSTAASFVAAACGAKVAKHGNRSVSSTSGSADVLEEAGVNLSVSADEVARAVETIGVGFMFAPAHHSAMKHAIGPRKELGMRTIFNMLGPMTNPAGVKRQVMGVFSKALCRPLAEVLKLLGSEHVMVVHSDDGLDEFSVAVPTHVAELKNGEVREYQVVPADLGIPDYADLSGLIVSSARASLALINQVFAGDDTQRKAIDTVVLNAGAAVYVAGVADSLLEGVKMAEDAIYSGAAKEKLQALVQFSKAQA